MSHSKTDKLISNLVSIGMPVYNGEKYITQAIGSLLKQDFDDFELIISDNASTDSTYDICVEFASKDTRVKYTRNETNIGAELNFKKVLDIANSNYFMWAACDDLWSQNYLSGSVKAMEENTYAVLTYATLFNIDDSGSIIRDYPELHLLSKPGSLFDRLENFLWFEESLGKANLIYGLMKTSVIKQIGPPKSYGFGNWGTDYLLVFNLLFHGKFIFLPQASFYKRLLKGTKYSADTLIDHYHEIQGYFQGYRKIIENSTLTANSKDLLLTSLAAREAEWYQKTLDCHTIPNLRKQIINLANMIEEKEHTTPNIENFDHTKAQTYELNESISWLRSNFESIYSELEESKIKFQETGEIWTGPGNVIGEFFNNNKKLWLDFIEHIKDKTCLEIGSGPCGAAAIWYFVKDWHIIEPLILEYKKAIIELFGKTWWAENIQIYPQNAEIFIPELEGKIAGAIVCRNALDHTKAPMIILQNISRYAAPGCKLLLWTDLYHLEGHNEGHGNITKSAEGFKKTLSDMNFEILYDTPSFRNGSTIEYGCVAVKEPYNAVDIIQLIPSSEEIEEERVLKILHEDFRNVPGLIRLAEIEIMRTNQKKARNLLIAAMAIDPHNITAKALLDKLR
jgi:glycosyltransferase involved in cell wall biosynthesis